MKLTRHLTSRGPRWAADGYYLDTKTDLDSLLALPVAKIPAFVKGILTGEVPQSPLLAPIDPDQEVWGGGVTYQRSREARRAESDVGDVYDRVYAAKRPELFFKSVGWRVRADQDPVRIRADSAWNVPEPELTLVINRYAEIVGYTAGNDMSSRSIEGENPLYLPQAKIYDGSCALGEAIYLVGVGNMNELPIFISIERAMNVIFQGETKTSHMNRGLEELVGYLFTELSFPQGVFLMTGTGIVPPDQFTLEQGDRIMISVGEARLTNIVDIEEKK
jgi:2-dehydro-3-deoxy-D-arabinonate dehydratase